MGLVERHSSSVPPAATPQAVEQLLAFRIRGSYLAIPASAVLQVDSLQPAVRLAQAPAWVVGLVPIASGAVPLLELERFVPLGQVFTASAGDAAEAGVRDSADSEQRAYADELPGRVLVVQAGAMRVGIRCDRVLGVVSVPAAVNRGATRGQRLSEFVSNEYEQSFGILLRLDLDKLLAAARLR